MTGYGLDYGNPVGAAIGAYTALRDSDLRQKEFEHKQAIDTQLAQQRQEQHDQATQKFNDERQANEAAGLEVEIAGHLNDPEKPGELPPQLIDRLVSTAPWAKQFLNKKYADQRKGQIDTMMTAYGDLVSSMQETAQTPRQAINAEAYDPALNASGNVGAGPGAIPLGATGRNVRFRPATPLVPAEQQLSSQAVAKNQLLSSMTDLFKDRLMVGKLIDFHPSPDGKAVALEVQFTRQDGSTYEAPITQNRSADPDDPVKFLPVKDIVQRMAIERALITGLRAQRAKYGDKEVLARMNALADRAHTEGREDKKAISDITEKQKDREARDKQNRDDNATSKANAKLSSDTAIKVAGMPARTSVDGANHLPAEAKLVEWMVANGIAPDKKTAYGLARQSKDNPKEMVLKLAHDAIKSRDASPYVRPGDPGYKTDEEIITSSQALVSKLGTLNAPAAITPSPAKPAPGVIKGTKTINNKPYFQDSKGQWFEADI